jgi:hypothetical protein
MKDAGMALRNISQCSEILAVRIDRAIWEYVLTRPRFQNAAVVQAERCGHFVLAIAPVQSGKLHAAPAQCFEK